MQDEVGNLEQQLSKTISMPGFTFGVLYKKLGITATKLQASLMKADLQSGKLPRHVFNYITNDNRSDGRRREKAATAAERDAREKERNRMTSKRVWYAATAYRQMVERRKELLDECIRNNAKLEQLLSANGIVTSKCRPEPRAPQATNKGAIRPSLLCDSGTAKFVASELTLFDQPPNGLHAPQGTTIGTPARSQVLSAAFVPAELGLFEQ
jgi:hypothetical protein